MNSLLSLVTFLPLIGAVVLMVFLRGEDELAQKNAKLLALFTTTATFLVSLFVLFGFDPANPGFQFVEERAWIGGLTYKMGVDGISVLFVLLTTFLMPLTIAASWGVKVRVKEYMAAFLVLETLMIGVFCALDLVLFYLFFEGGLIPMFLIIGIWGGKERIYASFKFFLYTFFGSVLMLVAMIAMYWQAGTTDIPTLMAYPFSSEPMRVLGFTVVGRPPQEDTSFGRLIHEITAPMVPKELPGVKALHAVDAAGVHPLLLAIGSERYVPWGERVPREILTIANAIQKVVLVRCFIIWASERRGRWAGTAA